jgi:formate hydrogenlyase subunit 3/multisubunit Na+/H+ antiporter MnhD subunit
MQQRRFLILIAPLVAALVALLIVALDLDVTRTALAIVPAGVAFAVAATRFWVRDEPRPAASRSTNGTFHPVRPEAPEGSTYRLGRGSHT